MAKENEEFDSSVMSDVYIRAYLFKEDCETKLYPCIRADDLFEVGSICCELLCKIKKFAPNIWEDRFYYFAGLDFPKDFELNMYERNVSKVLFLWGLVLDIELTVFDESALKGFYRDILLSLTTDDGESLKEYENREWWDLTESWLQEFYNMTLRVLNDIIHNVGYFLHKVAPIENPVPRLALIEKHLLEMEYIFFRNANARGPYMASEDSPPSYWNDGTVDLELGSQPGTLQTELIGGRNIRCRFSPDGINSTPIEWCLKGEGEEIRGYNRLGYKREVFETWNYTTGKFLGQWQTDQRAYWFIMDEAELEGYAYETIKLTLPIFNNSDYRRLAEKIIKVVKNNQPEWRPGEVQWSYVAELDGIIQECRLARKIYQAKTGKYASDIENIKTPEQTKKNTEKIPAGYKSPPMSKKQLAGYFGKDVNVPKVNAMMRAGSIKSERINRESFFFDLRSLPEYVQDKIINLMK